MTTQVRKISPENSPLENWKIAVEDGEVTDDECRFIIDAAYSSGFGISSNEFSELISIRFKNRDPRFARAADEIFYRTLHATNAQGSLRSLLADASDDHDPLCLFILSRGPLFLLGFAFRDLLHELY